MNNGAGSTFTEGWDALEAAFLAAVVLQQIELWPSKRVDVEVRLPAAQEHGCVLRRAVHRRSGGAAMNPESPRQCSYNAEAHTPVVALLTFYFVGLFLIGILIMAAILLLLGDLAEGIRRLRRRS